MEEFKFPKINMTQKQWKEFQEFKDEYLKKLRTLTFQQQEANDLLEGGLTSRNLMSFRNTMAFNECDSLDSENPFEMDFKVVSETIKIFSAKVSFKIKKFRAYSKTVPSGGGHTTVSGGGSTSGSGGGQTTSACGKLSYESVDIYIDGDKYYVLTQGGTPSALVILYKTAYDKIDEHTHTVDNHTHSTPNHQHAIKDHVHDLTFGIHEEDSSPKICFWISEDDGAIWKNKHGEYTKDQDDIDITSYLIRGNGNKMLRFTSDVRCRISASILLKLDLKAR